ncbi:MAG: hypothetical protein Kow0042_26200 [Calditrichia bacterium]
MKSKYILIIVLITICFSVFTARAQRLQAIHNVADPQLAIVDVYISTGFIILTKLEDIPFRTALRFVDVPIPGIPLNIGIAPGNSTSITDTVRNFPFTLSSGATYAAHFSGVVNPTQFAPNPDGISTKLNTAYIDTAREVSTVPGQVQFFFIHGVTDGPAMDIGIHGTAILVNDLAYREISPYFTLAPNTYRLSLMHATADTLLGTYLVDLSSFADSTMIIFTSGFMIPALNQNGAAMGLFAALPGGQVIEFPKISTHFSMEIIPDWNLIALPLEVANPYYLSVFPNALPGTLFKFEGAYVPEDTMEIGTGYWLRFPAPEVATIQGTPFTNCTINMLEGWNLIAGPSCDVSLLQVNDPGGIIIPGTLFGFNGAYFVTDSIKQGKGYWLRTSAPGQISISCGTLAMLPSMHKKNTPPNLEFFPRLEIEDRSGARQTLYFNVPLSNEDQIIQFSLPPLPPAVAFDARFAGDYRMTEGAEALIELQSSHYPIMITVSNLPLEEDYRYVIREVVPNGKGKVHVLKEGGEVEISDPQVATLKLSKERLVPLTFVVQQNYPNPFNPRTTIKYGIPQAERVEVAIYNTLGQKVKTLVSGNQEAGYYTVVWDATNDSGSKVSSGIYFYAVNAGKHRAVKKMFLLK